jgi:UDP-N-acetylglucosamine 3-dehydrogenase
MLRVGVIGLGGIGHNHARAYQAAHQADLVGICDAMPDRADAAAEQYGCQAYSDIETMLREARLDAVSVATGGFEGGADHYEPTIQCLGAGVHVLCEKPISNQIEQAREMVRTAREKGLYFSINLNHRFVPAANEAREWVIRGDLGDLLFINMALWINNPNDSSEWIHLRALHPHSIDVMRFFCGDVRRVQAFLHRAPGRTCWSTASLNMEFTSGVVGHLTGSYDMSMHHPIERCEVAGTKGRFVLENVYEQLTFYPRDSPEMRVTRNSMFGGMSGFADTFTRRVHRWLEQVSAGVPREEIEGSGEDGLAAQEVIEAGIRSFQNGSVEEVPLVPQQ